MSATADSTSEELVVRARRGEGDALGRLLARYGNYLELLASLQIGRRLQGKVDAADIVQETFLKAHEAFPQFRGASEHELLGWLRAILASCLAKTVRRYLGTKQRDARLERQLDRELGESSDAVAQALAVVQASPSERITRREEAVIVADALSDLPEHYRQVIVMRHFEQLAFAEVAQATGRSVGSVKKIWVRALARLRVALGEVP